jgi:hypothetical protein
MTTTTDWRYEGRSGKTDRRPPRPPPPEALGIQCTRCGGWYEPRAHDPPGDWRLCPDCRVTHQPRLTTRPTERTRP